MKKLNMFFFLVSFLQLSHTIPFSSALKKPIAATLKRDRLIKKQIGAVLTFSGVYAPKRYFRNDVIVPGGV